MLTKPSSSCAGCPLYEFPFGKKVGFSTPDWGDPGVLLVGEALGEDEEVAGTAFVGKSGQYLFSNLQRVEVERGDVSITNVLWCRPPNNKLVGMPYESKCVSHCSPNLDSAIQTHVSRSVDAGRTPVIVTLGKTAFKRVMGLDDKHPVMGADYLAYPFWSPTYNAWVLACDHPSYLMRGNHHLLPILQWTVKRAIEISENGLELQKPNYLLDPTPSEFSAWVDECLAQSGIISYDIETPFKQGSDEEEVSKIDDEDYTILRCSASYAPGTGVSAPWRAEYLADWRRLFASNNQKLGWNNSQYDEPRVTANLGMKLGGDQLDGMLAWHVLNSALPKGLGFVTPFYAKNVSMWKHLSNAEPAFYNCRDSDAALQIWLGVENDLKTYKLWDVFDRHVVKLNRIFSYMSSQGVLMDQAARNAAEQQVSKLLNDAQASMEACIPLEARALKVFKKTPKEIVKLENDGLTGEFIKSATGFVQVKGLIKTPCCPRCNVSGAKAAHFKSIGKKRLKLGETENPCVGLKAEKRSLSSLLWAKPLEFKVSPLSLSRYQMVKGHKAISVPDRNHATRTKRVTFDEKAILRLSKNYPKDPLYPLILEFRGLQKLLSTYIGTTDDSGMVRGGMPVEADGRVRTRFTHNPSTLRSASQNPNLQNLPRPQGKDDPATLIRNFFVAGPGNILLARDFSGIEAVLTGYFANAPNYVRLAKRDVHTFYTAYAIHQLDPGRIPANDLPLLTWDDDKLFTRLEELKPELKQERNNLYKHLVHACVTGDHEVLTPNGWQRFDELSDGVAVAQWDNGNLSFVTPDVIRTQVDGSLVRLDSRSASAVMTSNHRIPVVNSNHKLHERQAADLPKSGNIPVDGILAGDVTMDHHLIMLAVAIQADGGIDEWDNVAFHLVKQRKRDRLAWLLTSAGIEYKRFKCSDHDDGEHFRFKLPNLFGLLDKQKTFNISLLMTLTVECRQLFLDELLEWDGHKSNGKAGRQACYVSTNRTNVEAVQTIAHITGHQSIISSDTSCHEGRKPIWKASFNNRHFASLESANITTEPFKGDVYCVTVPSSWFLIRHNNLISVTGNSNFGQGAKGASDTILRMSGKEVSPYQIGRVMDIYYNLFPEIRKWHTTLLAQVDRDGFLRNPFGYVHRFFRPYEWTAVDTPSGKLEWSKGPGADANKIYAFLPQSTAAGIIKDAMLRMWENHYEDCGQFMRLLIHDEIFTECPESAVEVVDRIMRAEMEAPIQCMKLPWDADNYLTVETEAKAGSRWGQMEKY